MANPITHSENSMKKFGGKTDDDFNGFLKIHEKLDVSKHYYPNSKHRVLTHTMFWVHEVMLPLFGSYIILSSGRKISVKDICEQHILEDYNNKLIPTPQDFLDHLEVQPWMNNGDDEIKPIVKPKDMKDIFKDMPIPPHNPYPGYPNNPWARNPWGIPATPPMITD